MGGRFGSRRLGLSPGADATLPGLKELCQPFAVGDGETGFALGLLLKAASFPATQLLILERDVEGALESA